MRLDPSVDTGDVKGVLALGEKAEDIGVVKPGETDGALEAGAGAAERIESKEREGINRNLFDAGGLEEGQNRSVIGGKGGFESEKPAVAKLSA